MQIDVAEKDARVMVLLGETFYRSDLVAENVLMHKNTLLLKYRQKKIKGIRHGHAVWFKKAWIEEFIESGTV